MKISTCLTGLVSLGALLVSVAGFANEGAATAPGGVGSPGAGSSSGGGSLGATPGAAAEQSGAATGDMNQNGEARNPASAAPDTSDANNNDNGVITGGSESGTNTTTTPGTNTGTGDSQNNGD